MSEFDWSFVNDRFAQFEAEVQPHVDSLALLQCDPIDNCLTATQLRRTPPYCSHFVAIANQYSVVIPKRLTLWFDHQCFVRAIPGDVRDRRDRYGVREPIFLLPSIKIDLSANSIAFFTPTLCSLSFREGPRNLSSNVQTSVRLLDSKIAM